MVFLCLANFWVSQYHDIRLEESKYKSWQFECTSWAMCWSCHLKWLQISSYWWTSPPILQFKWLFIITYKGISITGLQYLLDYDKLVLFMKTKFSIWIWVSKPAEIWTQTYRTKSSYDNHWAHSTDLSLSSFFLPISAILSFVLFQSLQSLDFL